MVRPAARARDIGEQQGLTLLFPSHCDVVAQAGAKVSFVLMEKLETVMLRAARPQDKHAFETLLLPLLPKQPTPASAPESS